MRFPLVREFTASYRAAPDREERLRAWHDASMDVRREHLLRVIVQVGLTLGFILLAFYTALHGGELISLSVAVLCFASALVFGYRHFAEIDDRVLKTMKQVEHPPGRTLG
jgi:hypothetical protein